MDGSQSRVKDCLQQSTNTKPEKSIQKLIRNRLLLKHKVTPNDVTQARLKTFNLSIKYHFKIGKHDHVHRKLISGDTKSF